jgi:hypothetical protein
MKGGEGQEGVYVPGIKPRKPLSGGSVQFMSRCCSKHHEEGPLMMTMHDDETLVFKPQQSLAWPVGSQSSHRLP